MDGRTALFEAAENGPASVIDILLKAGAIANFKDGDDRTALDFALKHGHETLRILSRSLPEKVWLDSETNKKDFSLSNPPGDAESSFRLNSEVTWVIGRES